MNKLALAALAATGWLIASQPVQAVGSEVGLASARTTTPPHRLAYEPNDHAMIVLNVTTGSTAVMKDNASSIQSVALSRTGDKVAWLYYYDEPIPSNRIMIRDTDARHKARNVLAAHPRKFLWIDSVDWAPTGKRLAFIGAKPNGDTDLWTVKADGTGLSLVKADVIGCGDNCGRVIWSPDGRKVAYFFDDWDRNKVGWRQVTLKTGKTSRLPKCFFGWSPDMKLIGRVLGDGDSPSRLVISRPNRQGARRLQVPAPDDWLEYHGGDISWGAGRTIGYRTQETDEYVFVDVKTSAITVLAPTDPTRGGAYDFS
ncbi:MAG: hypothetical protein V9F00_04720 [Nocardioides sp.]